MHSLNLVAPSGPDRTAFVQFHANLRLLLLQIKIKSDALLTGYTANGLVFSDGSEVKADVIVFATGFVGNLRQHVEEIFGKEIADRAGDCFGLNEEGEILGAFKPLKRKYITPV